MPIEQKVLENNGITNVNFDNNRSKAGIQNNHESQCFFTSFKEKTIIDSNAFLDVNNNEFWEFHESKHDKSDFNLAEIKLNQSLDKQTVNLAQEVNLELDLHISKLKNVNDILVSDLNDLKSANALELIITKGVLKNQAKELMIN